MRNVDCKRYPHEYRDAEVYGDCTITGGLCWSDLGDGFEVRIYKPRRTCGGSSTGNSSPTTFDLCIRVKVGVGVRR